MVNKKLDFSHLLRVINILPPLHENKKALSPFYEKNIFERK